jgi:hypothetical protein
MLVDFIADKLNNHGAIENKARLKVPMSTQQVSV